MLKITLNLFILIKYYKNKILMSILKNKIDFNGITKLINLINIIFSILKIKLVNLAKFLLS